MSGLRKAAPAVTGRKVCSVDHDFTADGTKIRFPGKETHYVLCDKQGTL